MTAAQSFALWPAWAVLALVLISAAQEVLDRLIVSTTGVGATK